MGHISEEIGRGGRIAVMKRKVEAQDSLLRFIAMHMPKYDANPRWKEDEGNCCTKEKDAAVDP